jgi:D-alanyl-D-alanine carboxypeptidase
MYFTRVLFYVVALTIVVNTSFAQNIDNTTSRLDSLLNAVEVRPFNGVILIKQQGKVLYENAIGFADYDKKIPNKMENEFVLLSNSKQITAVLILMAADDGLLQLENPIGQYLPTLSMPWANVITIHQLLNHSSGLDAADKPLLFEPGTSFKYADINYVLLGQIIESVRHQTYADIATALFNKLGLKHTYVPNAYNQQNLIIGKKMIEGELPQLIDSVIIAPHKIPAAGIVSTVSDLSTWVELLHTGEILSDTIYQKLIHYNITAQHVAFGPQKIGYSYGLRIDDLNEPVYYGHTGTSPDQGFTSFTLWFPKSQTSVVVLENCAYDNMDVNYYYEAQIRAIMTQSNWVK